MAAFNIDGLVSGLDTASIVEGLVALQQQQVDRLTAKKVDIQVKQQAFQGVEARLLSLRSKLGSLNRSSGGAFTGKSVSSSNEDIVTATATSKAATGSYSLRVTSRAQSHQLGSAGFTSSSQSITNGTIAFQVGDRPATEITIDDTNNTVGGLVEAINNQSGDVSAALIHDQATNSDRILLTSKHAGTDNEIVITNNLAAAAGDVARPDFSGPAVQDAANATIQLGTGPGAIFAEFGSNQVEDLIEGVTLDLKQVNVNTDVVINVERDTTQATESIQGFVEEYNLLIDYINEQSKFNSETAEASPLLGNRSVANLKNELGSMMTNVVPGLGGLNRFSQIGIQIDGTGKLTLDTDKLGNALSGQIDGVNADDVPKLFRMAGQSNHAGIQFLQGSASTKTTKTPIEIDITQAAERAVVTGTNSIASSIVIDGTNNDLQLSVDGITSEALKLTAGTYTQEQLTNHLQSVINASPKLGKHNVSVSMDGNFIKLTTEAYGSSAEISDLSGSALSVLGFSGTESNSGVDVAGSFIVDGVTELATGNGRVLIGDSENENTADLQLRVTLSPAQVVAGAEGELTVTDGVTSRLDKFLAALIDPEKGSLATITESFNSRIDSIDASIERVNTISDAKRDFLIRQFAALESALSELQTTSSVVSSQLAGIS